MAHGSSSGRLSRRAGDIRGKNFLASGEQRNGATRSVVPQRPFWGVFTQGKRFFPVWNADSNSLHSTNEVSLQCSAQRHEQIM